METLNNGKLVEQTKGEIFFSVDCTEQTPLSALYCAALTKEVRYYYVDYTLLLS